MERVEKKPKPERDQTDESLRAERKSTDEALAEKHAIEANADEVLEVAREQADGVLETARQRADSKVAVGAAAEPGRAAAVVKARSAEDKALQIERADADETLKLEREAQARKLASLWPLERERTDRFLLTERARSDEAVAYRDDFMGIVSHDLRNLLSGIMLNAELLSNGASDSDEGKRTVIGMQRVQRYVARMNRLIGDLVDVASIDAGKLAIQPTRSDATALVSEALDAFSQTATEKGISLSSDTLVDAVPADFDHDRLLQVLANLISNALKFTPPGGVVAVRCEAEADGVRFSVRDTGMGIAASMLEAVFVRFWQVGKNDSRGVGLGLYISKCIVEAHGGKIWADSRLGAGSVFQFTIPDSHPSRGRSSCES